MSRIVVIGGTGQIGTKVVSRLRHLGREVRVAARSTAVDTVTGAGLESVLDGAEIVIDVSKPPTHDQRAMHDFFQTGTENVLRAERAFSIRHHVVLSIVGSARAEVPFYRGKAAAEQIVRDSGVPFSIVHATQFFEFAPGIAAASAIDGVVTLPDALVQPAAGADVADAIIEIALAVPLRSDVEIAGPERMPLTDFITRSLRARGDDRTVHAAADGRYFGGPLEPDTLLPRDGARILPTTLDEWLASQSGSDANLLP
ncbi:LysR family transcriptional regulator [Microbacterium sp. H1-D42]|uniref:SDR family oxidoreductase n=1 Tax=Microbacterium sp. H1-D42 TaxID=2925844 RepID=UPI001F52C44D|nr:LysR family transcriptional regulator [Microbacterium sp. H1-D42]UNK71533.1 LysR family transcriptional regulator [Microbacterium sp. H1-D42]